MKRPATDPAFGDVPTTPYHAGLPPSTTAAGPVRGLGTFHAGMVFANHRLERVLGQGGMGMVWFGRHLTLDRPAAIKVRLGGADDVIGRERFLREARTCAQVRHPHVIGIHDAGVVDGIEYLAMDYVEGGSLADRLRLYPTGLPLAEVLRLAEAAAQGLAAIHALGLVHRDIKPANLLLTAGERVIVADFGLAKPPDISQDLTAGRVVGTPRFLAPEMIQGRPGDARSDLYALGVTLFEALTGRPLFQADTHLHLFHLITSAPLPLVHDLRPEIPSEVSRLIADLLDRDPRRRPASAEEFLGRLAALSLPSAPSTESPSRRWLLPSLLTAAVVIFAIAIVFMASSPAVVPVALVPTVPQTVTTSLPPLIPGNVTSVQPTQTALPVPRPIPAPVTEPVSEPVSEPGPAASVTVPQHPTAPPLTAIETGAKVAPVRAPPPADDRAPVPTPPTGDSVPVTIAPLAATPLLLPTDAPVGSGMTSSRPTLTPITTNGPSLPIGGSEAVHRPSNRTKLDTPPQVTPSEGDPFANDFLAVGWRCRFTTPWEGIYADEGHLVAWGNDGVAVSDDQGATWSEPVPTWDGGPVPISEAVFAGGICWVRTSDGSLRQLGGQAMNRVLGLAAASRIAPCGDGILAVESGGTQVVLIVGGARGPAAKGRLVATLKGGAIVLDGTRAVWLTAGGGGGSVEVTKAGRPLIACGPPGGFALTRDGEIWHLENGQPAQRGRISLTIASLGYGRGPGNVEAIGTARDPVRGQVFIGVDRSGSVAGLTLDGHQPDGLTMITSCGRDHLAGVRTRLVAVGPGGLWVHRVR